MSFNRELMHRDLDMNGHAISNAKPQYLDKHPSTLGLFKGFEYYNTVDNVKYIFNGSIFTEYKGPKGERGPQGLPGKDGVKGDKGTDGKNADLTIAAGVGLSYNTKTEKIDLGTSTANDGTEYDLKTLGEIINKLESRITALESNV